MLFVILRLRVMLLPRLNLMDKRQTSQAHGPSGVGISLPLAGHLITPHIPDYFGFIDFDNRKTCVSKYKKKMKKKEGYYC